MAKKTKKEEVKSVNTLKQSVPIVSDIFMKASMTQYRQNGQLISLALVSASTGSTFYAEFNDYNREDVSQDAKSTVIPRLIYPDVETARDRYNNGERTPNGLISYSLYIKGDHVAIKKDLVKWLNNEHKLEKNNLDDVNGDVLFRFVCNKGSYDWVLFIDLLTADGQIGSNNINTTLRSAKYILDNIFDVSTMFSAYLPSTDVPWGSVLPKSERDIDSFINITNTKIKRSDRVVVLTPGNAIYDALEVAKYYYGIMGLQDYIIKNANIK